MDTCNQELDNENDPEEFTLPSRNFKITSSKHTYGYDMCFKNKVQWSISRNIIF